jgi:hypothetical protein
MNTYRNRHKARAHFLLMHKQHYEEYGYHVEPVYANASDYELPLRDMYVEVPNGRQSNDSIAQILTGNN